MIGLLGRSVFGTLPTYLAVCAVLLGAQLIYVLIGFGAGMIAVGALAMLLPSLQDSVVVLMLVNMPVELFVALSARQHVDRRTLISVGSGLLVGAPLGSLGLRFADPRLALFGLGLFLLLVAATFLLLPAKQLRWPFWAGLPVGLLAGAFGSMFSAAGPTLVLYFRLAGASKDTFRGSLMALFFVNSCLRLISYAAVGLFDPRRLLSALLLVPVILLGAWLGNAIQMRLSQSTFERLVLAALVCIGGLLLGRAL
ncbi:MAG: sulfite exporter TauE/SafE family protein [Deltaproteobacteria bacterium]|nr:sulfite exporter TauE/SafE family protein [Deltaproteobacteria bacterium]